MKRDPALLLDVSRLISRLGGGPATGIDRVEAEWLAHLQGRPHLLLCRVPRGQLLLPPLPGRQFCAGLTAVPRTCPPLAFLTGCEGAGLCPRVPGLRCAAWR
ncbi:hypothetical protein ACFSS8_00675 [Paracoccus kondratievae]